MKGVICVQEQNYSASDINTCIQLQLNCEYHNSAFSVYSVYQFINNKYICLILPNEVNNCSYLYVPYQRSTLPLTMAVCTAGNAASTFSLEKRNVVAVFMYFCVDFYFIFDSGVKLSGTCY